MKDEKKVKETPSQQSLLSIAFEAKNLPISGTLVTEGIPGLVLGDFSKLEADLLHLSSGILGLDLGCPPPPPALLPKLLNTCPPLLGPQVLPFTPSVGTAKKKINCGNISPPVEYSVMVRKHANNRKVLHFSSLKVS